MGEQEDMLLSLERVGKGRKCEGGNISEKSSDES